MAQMPPNPNYFHLQTHQSHAQHQPLHSSFSHGQPPMPTLNNLTAPPSPTALPPASQLQYQSQLQMPTQIGQFHSNMLFDDCGTLVNYNYMHPYLSSQRLKPEDVNSSLVMRRPRRTRTTFTSLQITELEKQFLRRQYLNTSDLTELSSRLALGTTQVKIWFKNRRRRQKIQEKPKDALGKKPESGGSEPPMPESPQPITRDEEQGSCLFLAPNMHGNTVPAALTPSPTPSTTPASLMEPFGDGFNSSSYYNNNNKNNPQHDMYLTGSTSPPPARTLLDLSHMRSTHPRPQMFTQPPDYFTQSCQLPPQMHYQDHGQHCYDGYQPYTTALHGDKLMPSFDGQSSVVIKKKGPDLNCNNPYYMRMPESASTGNVTSTSISAAIEPKSNATAALSPNPNGDIYEPLTPQNDESTNLSNSNNSASSNSCSSSSSSSSASMATDHMDDENSTKTLQTLKPYRNNVAADSTSCSTEYRTALSPPTSISTYTTFNSSSSVDMNDEYCDVISSKYTKLTVITSDTNEKSSSTSSAQPTSSSSTSSSSSNYQCTIDTLMHTCNTQRTNSSPQFAYCFN